MTARARSLLAALLLVAAVSGCGVPSGSGVVVEGRGPDEAPVTGEDLTSEPDGRAATTDPVQFIQNYLAAAAGDPTRALVRARDFFAPEARAAWTPDGQQVQVLQLQGDPKPTQETGGYRVTVTGTVLGVLGDNGTFQSRPPSTRELTFRIARNTDGGGTGLFLTEAPNGILLSNEALLTYFELRTIYFWSEDRRVLVPDLRYLPRRDVPEAQRPTLIIDWLLRGPSPWLEPAVESLPDTARQVGKVPAADDRVLRVELSKAADIDDAEAVGRLATQLRWSLRTGTANPTLELGIDQFQDTFAGTGYLEANPSYRAGTVRPRFGLVRGQVRRLEQTGTEAPAAPIVPSGPANTHVVRAALAVQGDRTLVALLRRPNQGQAVLDVGSVASPADRLRRIGLRGDGGTRVGQPVWLPGTDTGLVLVAGRLRTFRASGGGLQALAGVPSPITSFAVPPDGRRLAYVAGGRLYVAPLIHGRTLQTGERGDHLQVPVTLSRPTAVAWSQQTWLAVAGESAPGQNRVEDVTVDGAVRDDWSRGDQRGGPAIDHLVASTDDTADGPGAGQVMYVAGNIAYELFVEPGELSSEDVTGADAAPADAVPTYPFYVE